MLPKVSVLIAAYNHAEFLPASLSSVIVQTVRPHQVIVINDGSTDDTERVLQAYGSRIEVINQPNQGKSAAVNTAMQRVTGDYIWIMDADDVALPDALERHLEILERRPEVGFTCSSYYWSEGGKIQLRIQPDPSDPDFFVRLLNGRTPSFFQGKLVRTSCFREVGAFDPELRRAQDWDMFIRLFRQFTCAPVPAPTIFYRWDWGLHGSMKDRYRSEDFFLKCLLCDQKVLRKARAETPLYWYLPRTESVSHNLSSLEVRRALLQRASIMAGRDVSKEMSEDLRLAAEICPDCALSPVEQDILWEFPWCRDKLPRPWSLWRNREALQNTGTITKNTTLHRSEDFSGIRYELVRGIYWRAIRAWRANDRAHALVLLYCGCRLMGIRGILKAGLGKVFRRLSIRPRWPTADSTKEGLTWKQGEGRGL